jgi:DNA-binding CsgD family transcriptional regulator
MSTVSLSGGPVPSLDERELRLLRMKAEGARAIDIAPQLHLSPGGVLSLTQRIVHRLGARNIAQAIHLAHELGLFALDPAVVLPQPLVQVLELVAEGRTNAEISRILGRSEHTVADQVREVRRRLGARDRAHAVALAMDARLIRRPSRVVTAA